MRALCSAIDVGFRLDPLETLLYQWCYTDILYMWRRSSDAVER